MCIDEIENDSEFKDNNPEDIVIGELIADLCSAKNKATTIVPKLTGFFQ